MFSIRFIKHDGSGHKSYACTDYEVDKLDEFVEVRMTLKDGSEYLEQIGDAHPYDVAYVTNEAGRTIDKIALRG